MLELKSFSFVGFEAYLEEHKKEIFGVDHGVGESPILNELQFAKQVFIALSLINTPRFGTPLLEDSNFFDRDIQSTKIRRFRLS